MTDKEFGLVFLIVCFLAFIFLVLFLSVLYGSSFLKKDIEYASDRINKLLIEKEHLEAIIQGIKKTRENEKVKLFKQ